MGIKRFTETAKVLKHTIEKFVQMTTEVWKDFNQEARLYDSSGEDAPPCKDDQLILVKIDGTGKYIAAGVLTVSRGAKPGEKIIYARDADAEIVSKISMLNDGSINLEAEGDITEKTKKNHTTEAEGDITQNTKNNFTVSADKDISTKATGKNTVKGRNVEVNGNVLITGGTLECNGIASPTGSGCWCAKPFCTWDGSPHTGNIAQGT